MDGTRWLSNVYFGKAEGLFEEKEFNERVVMNLGNLLTKRGLNHQIHSEGIGILGDHTRVDVFDFRGLDFAVIYELDIEDKKCRVLVNSKSMNPYGYLAAEHLEAMIQLELRKN